MACTRHLCALIGNHKHTALTLMPSMIHKNIREVKSITRSGMKPEYCMVSWGGGHRKNSPHTLGKQIPFYLLIYGMTRYHKKTGPFQWSYYKTAIPHWCRSKNDQVNGHAQNTVKLKCVLRMRFYAAVRVQLWARRWRLRE